MNFRSVVELGGKSATGIRVPDDVIAALSTSRRPSVAVTVNGYTYRTTAARMGDAFFVPLSAENRSAAGLSAGDEVEVEIVLDDAPREVAVPDDLAAALTEARMRDRFDGLAYSHRREHVRAVQDAKTAATRQRRIAAAIEKLRAS